MSAPKEWLPVTESPFTERLEVEGGHLYRVASAKGMGLVFVPEIGNRFGTYLEQIVDALDSIREQGTGQSK